MKGGKVPIHIQRWAPADFQADEVVKLLLSRHDYRALIFYRQFLDVSFMAGGDLPAAPEALAACLSMPLADVRKALTSIQSAEEMVGRVLLEEGGGRLSQKRVRAEVEEELEFRGQQAEHGKKRWAKASHRLASDNPKSAEKASLSPPTPSASALRQRQAPTPAPDEFSAFWAAYPRKVNKGDARKAWKQTAEERPPLPALLATLETLKATPQWAESGGRFIPYPASWLRAGGWEDDPAALGAGGNGRGALSPPPLAGPVVADYGGTLKAKLNRSDPNERPLTREEWVGAHPETPWPGPPAP